jgi:tRNA (guanosine-2'-O-)-methyltransferase
MIEMTPERTQKFQKVANRRQGNLTVILENVHDTHNIGAVLRTCDSVGIDEIFILYTDPRLTPSNIKLGKRTSAGARKWVTVHQYFDVTKCFRAVKAKYKRIYATHLDADSVGLYDLNLSQSIALLFGNEHRGVSEAALAYVDGNFIIPQVGMVESLNISVACAVSLYEAFRQRQAKDYYVDNPTTTKTEKQALYDDYADRHKLRKSTFRPEEGE